MNFEVGDIVTFSFASALKGVIVAINEGHARVMIPKWPTLKTELIRLHDLRFVSRQTDGNDILKGLL